MSEVISVRVALPSDAERLGHIKVTSWRAAYAGLLPDQVLADLSIPYLVDEFRKRLRDKASSTTALVATIEEAGTGLVCGYAMVGPYRWDELTGAGEVYAIYVDPSHWGMGAGRALLSAAEQCLLDRGFAAAALWVLEANLPGRVFYEAMGWSTDGQRGERCEVENAPEIRYRKNLF
ncbi:MAG TPA: GNAT family N-acetyltransferase [Actinomycetes bacterium]|nr:GNAT family N-acetyltransferase [Actinomycetes bacterium]